MERRVHHLAHGFSVQAATEELCNFLGDLLGMLDRLRMRYTQPGNIVNVESVLRTV